MTYAPFDFASLGLKWTDIATTLPKLREGIELLNSIVWGAGFAWDHAERISKENGLNLWRP